MYGNDGFMAVLPSTTGHWHVFTSSVLQCRAVQRSAMQCSETKYSALHCSALQCIVVNYSALPCIAVHCSGMQCIASHCSALQCIAVHCSSLQCLEDRVREKFTNPRFPMTPQSNKRNLGGCSDSCLVIIHRVYPDSSWPTSPTTDQTRLYHNFTNKKTCFLSKRHF